MLLIKGRDNVYVIIETSTVNNCYGIDSAAICLSDNSRLDIKQSTFNNLNGLGTGAIKLASNRAALIQMCNFNDIVSYSSSDFSFGAAGIFVTPSTNATLIDTNFNSVTAHSNGEFKGKIYCGYALYLK